AGDRYHPDVVLPSPVPPHPSRTSGIPAPARPMRRDPSDLPRFGIEMGLHGHSRGRLVRNSYGVTCARYSSNSTRLLRRKKSKTWSPRVSATSSESSIARIASSRLRGSGSMPRADRSRSVSDHTSFSASGGSSYSPSMPASPADRISANAKYGLPAQSIERRATRAEDCLFGLYIGTRTSADRLLRPQQM